MMKSEGHIESLRIDERSRRDFLIVSTSTLAATGVALSVWPLIDSLNPGSVVLRRPLQKRRQMIARPCRIRRRMRTGSKGKSG